MTGGTQDLELRASQGVTSSSDDESPGTVNKINISGLHKTFDTKAGQIVALENIDLAIRQNEFVALVGPSGCGKSTLLNIIGALTPPSQGSVLLDGTPHGAPSRDIGIVFQDAVLLPWRTVFDNVMLPAEILGFDLEEYRHKAAALLELVGLKGFEEMAPGELSGGMQQRVSICRALVHNPSVLLMDEPFAALDAMTREELGFELLRIWDAYRKTVVFVTHNISEAVLLAGRVVVITSRPGRIAEIIEIDLPRPRTLEMTFTQEFKSYSDRIRAHIFAGRKDQI